MPESQAPCRRSSLGRAYQEERFYLEVICPFEIAGDLNDDCRVDFADLAIMASDWLTNSIFTAYHPGPSGQPKSPGPQNLPYSRHLCHRR